MDIEIITAVVLWALSGAFAIGWLEDEIHGYDTGGIMAAAILFGPLLIAMIVGRAAHRALDKRA